MRAVEGSMALSSWKKEKIIKPIFLTRLCIIVPRGCPNQANM